MGWKQDESERDSGFASFATPQFFIFGHFARTISYVVKRPWKCFWETMHVFLWLSSLHGFGFFQYECAQEMHPPFAHVTLLRPRTALSISCIHGTNRKNVRFSSSRSKHPVRYLLGPMLCVRAFWGFCCVGLLSGQSFLPRVSEIEINIKHVSNIGNTAGVSTNTFSQRMAMVESSSLEFFVPCWWHHDRGNQLLDLGHKGSGKAQGEEKTEGGRFQFFYAWGALVVGWHLEKFFVLAVHFSTHHMFQLLFQESQEF